MGLVAFVAQEQQAASSPPDGLDSPACDLSQATAQEKQIHCGAGVGDQGLPPPCQPTRQSSPVARRRPKRLPGRGCGHWWLTRRAGPDSGQRSTRLAAPGATSAPRPPGLPPPHLLRPAHRATQQIGAQACPNRIWADRSKDNGYGSVG
ncbi:hypothetical protein HKBW3S42_00069 [Candidatus Hakubella thermalkaliphila]|uniref:Uncharacterized protein n=1 Tax=Candidatus Hakubella thermalkaliphila TaxID=2754717 RepID=A0A6V8PGI5_9ACTN|nr:hypothetical protein HKBW3S42_00069 [Candidatus Hakubella thermalkaliphila]